MSSAFAFGARAAFAAASQEGSLRQCGRVSSLLARHELATHTHSPSVAEPSEFVQWLPVSSHELLCIALQAWHLHLHGIVTADG